MRQFIRNLKRLFGFRPKDIVIKAYQSPEELERQRKVIADRLERFIAAGKQHKEVCEEDGCILGQELLAGYEQMIHREANLTERGYFL